MKKLFALGSFVFLVCLSCVSCVQAEASQAFVVDASAARDVYVVNIKDFGAVDDSLTLNSKSIQAAIDDCYAKGGGKVWVPAGYFVTGTIEIKSNVTLSLDYGAYLLGSQNLADYRTDVVKSREGTSPCLLYAANEENICIEGLGVIDGRGTPEFFPKKKPGDNRPPLLNFINCKNVTFTGVTYCRPAFWGLHLTDCEDVHFNGITLRFRNNGMNNDGLDLDGCKNVIVENCDIESGDDGICLKSSLYPCENFIIRNNRVASNTAALKFGTSSRGGFINFDIYNCYFYNCPMGAIKLQLVDGGVMENIKISRILMEDVGNPIFLRLGNRAHDYGSEMKDNTGVDAGNRKHDIMGTMKNIHISDINATVTFQTRENGLLTPYTREALSKRDDAYWDYAGKTRSGPIMITGIPGNYIENVLLENINISYPGGTLMSDVEEVSEDEDIYPEQYFFGILPAWGAYVRHAKNVEFKNVNLTLRGSDEREKIVLDDVIDFVNK